MSTPGRSSTSGRACASGGRSASGVGVSRFQTTGGAGVAAGLPHPFHFEQFRTVDGSAAATRQETAVHVQLAGRGDGGMRLDVTLFGGPTFFDVAQTLVSDVLFEEIYPYDTATFSSAPTVQRSATAVGFNAGLDLATYLTPTVGVGVLVRFSRAMVDLARPDGGGALAVEAGGLHVGGGLHLRF